MNRIPLQHRGKRPRFYPNAGTDELISMVLELTAALSVLRERVYVLERVIDRGEGPIVDRIEQYRPSAVEARELETGRRQLISTVLRSLEANNVESRQLAEEVDSTPAGGDAAGSRAQVRAA